MDVGSADYAGAIGCATDMDVGSADYAGAIGCATDMDIGSADYVEVIIVHTLPMMRYFLVLQTQS